MTIGDPILPASEFGHRVKNSALDPKTALKEILGAYLRGLEFVVSGDVGELVTAPTSFKLEGVTTDWPDPDKELEYPSASITVPDETGLEGHSLAPTAIESSWGVHDCPGVLDGSVLWKLGELAVEMQVDFWANTIVGRDAIAARLPGAFAPGEGARRVLLEGSPLYWGLAGRYSLEASPTRTSRARSMRTRGAWP